jgi:hypothetical protein
MKEIRKRRRKERDINKYERDQGKEGKKKKIPKEKKEGGKKEK